MASFFIVSSSTSSQEAANKDPEASEPNSSNNEGEKIDVSVFQPTGNYAENIGSIQNQGLELMITKSALENVTTKLQTKASTLNPR